MGNATQPCRAIQDTETVEAVEAVEAADGATSCGLCVHEYLFPMYVVKAGAMGPLGHWAIGKVKNHEQKLKDSQESWAPGIPWE